MFRVHVLLTYAVALANDSFREMMAKKIQRLVLVASDPKHYDKQGSGMMQTYRRMISENDEEISANFYVVKQNTKMLDTFLLTALKDGWTTTLYSE